MPKLFDRLQYSFTPSSSGVIIEYSDAVKESMNTLSSFLPEWGYEDMRNSNVGGYLINPVSGTIQLIIDTCQDIYIAANSAANVLGDIANTSLDCQNASVSFYNHTNRLSGVVDIDPTTVTLPHYDTAISIGKAVTHLVFQSDGYANSSTILGSFTSVLVNDDLVIYYNTIKDYPNTINSSISGESSNATSNLDANVVNTIIYNIQTITNFVMDRKYHDENFYTQSRLMVEDYDELKRFIDNGQTETHLIENYLQSDKLKERY